MDPFTTAAVALGTVVGTKALEKTGEKIGEVVWDKSAKFLETLKQESPNTVKAIEQAPDQPLDYGQAVLEVEQAATENPDVAQRMQELATAAKADPNPKLAEILQEIAEELKSQKSSMPKLEKLADKIGQVAIQGGKGTIQNQTF
ncbi:MAG: hypothetical protein WBA93_00650 [Microcoleaceae cyanobacterium]